MQRTVRRLVLGLPPATALILYAAARGGSDAQLLILAVMTGAIAGVIVLPVGGIELSPRTPRLRAAAAIAAGALALPLVVLALAAVLARLASAALAAGVAATIALAGSYAVGAAIAAARLSARGRRTAAD